MADDFSFQSREFTFGSHSNLFDSNPLGFGNDLILFKDDSYFDDQIKNQWYKNLFDNNIPGQNNSSNYQLQVEDQSTGYATGKVQNFKEIPNSIQDQEKEKKIPNSIQDQEKEKGIPNSIQDQEKEKKIPNSIQDQEIEKESNIKIEIDNNKEFVQKKRKRQNKNNQVLKENQKCGRKNKKSLEERTHTKYNEDNMITKIKVVIINSILVLLNSCFIHINFSTGSSPKFLKIEPDKYNTIKKDKNLEMLDLTIRELLSNEICTKNYTEDDNHNIELINKIYKEKVETDIINILNLTFRDFLNLFRLKISKELEKKISDIKYIKEKFMNITGFIEKIKQQEKKKGETDEKINEYINRLVDLCGRYENWFNDKKGRERKKNEDETKKKEEKRKKKEERRKINPNK